MIEAKFGSLQDTSCVGGELGVHLIRGSTCSTSSCQLIALGDAEVSAGVALKQLELPQIS